MLKCYNCKQEFYDDNSRLIPYCAICTKHIFSEGLEYPPITLKEVCDNCMINAKNTHDQDLHTSVNLI